MYFLRKLKHFFLTLFVLTYIIFEKLIWDYIAEPTYAYIKEKDFFKRFMAHVEHDAHRAIIMGYFLLFFGAAEGMGVLAMILLGLGNVPLFLLLYIAKIPVAIIAFAILNVGKDKLNTYFWFRKTYGAVMWVIDKIKDSSIYKSIMKKAKKTKASIIEYIKEVKTKYFSGNSSLKELLKASYKGLKTKLSL